jgi:hypothetical protein
MSNKNKTCCVIVYDKPCGRTATRFNAESHVAFCDEHSGEKNPTYSSALAELCAVGRALAAYQPAANAKTQKEADLWAKFYALIGQ